LDKALYPKRFQCRLSALQGVPSVVRKEGADAMMHLEQIKKGLEIVK